MAAMTSRWLFRNAVHRALLLSRTAYRRRPAAVVACAVSKRQVADEEPSFPAEGLGENKNNGRTNPMQVVEIRTDQSFGEGQG